VEAGSFFLVKWYMDCVADSGDAAIVYCAELRWRGLHAAYSSVLSVDGASVEAHASMARYRLSSTDGEILVELPRLGVSSRWEASAAPFEQTVYEDASGSVLWNCQQPRASAHLRIGDRELAGLGYAERLTVTLPPWRLPMSRLRWGRFVSPGDSLAWIDWQGPYSTSFAVHNGVRCETLSVSDSEVAMRDATLRMEESFPLRAGRLGSTILPGAPALRKMLPRSLANIEEYKWRSRGILNAQGHSGNGWAIHEVVHWKT
jgi:hypothetical protein